MYSSRISPHFPNDTTSIISDPIVTAKPLAGFLGTKLSAMASGPSTASVELPKGLPRTSSFDSSKSNSSSKSTDVLAGATDVANLIKAAGSPEAVIQYLLKEKQSQSQQNTQLWRLVDKQRAMILGLNKDFERALKDKEKYRKKMREVMSVHDAGSKHDTMDSAATMTAAVLPRVDVDAPQEQSVEIPASPSNIDSDSVKHSPIDLAMAPYPITPPADQMSNGPLSAVGELLDPSHAMPKPSEHALDNFDHEEQDRAALEAMKADETGTSDSHYSVKLPPSRSLPSEPPSIPPPKPPVSVSPTLDNKSQFPPPSAPPRKPPPAPLQLKKESKVSTNLPPEDENDSDSDFDDLLEVNEIPLTENRGRRRTREEDDRDREVVAQQEAERRSLSRKSKQGTPTGAEFESQSEKVPASPPPSAQTTSLASDNISSLAGVLSGNTTQTFLNAPLMSPGLPASPRPTGQKPMASPPLSPRAIAMALPPGPLSQRAPRQSIPLPPNTPLSSPPVPGEPLILSSPKPLNIKKAVESTQPSPPASRDSQVEPNKIYRGFTTEEYPDLLLPPNALPSIEVRVASSRMKPSRASLTSLTQLEEDPVFTLAVFARVEGPELWRMEKDSQSLAKLDQRLKQCSTFTARTPDRSLFSGHAPAKLDARRIVLNQYLEELLNTPLDTATGVELCKYLSTNTLPPNSDETGSAPEPRQDTSIQKTGPGGRPFKSGYLTKRGKNFGGWKARFFVLDGPHLKYYETPGGAHLGTIKLQNAQIGKQSQQSADGASPARGSNDDLDNQYRHAFLVLEPKKKDSSSHVKHVLCAESDGERDQWVDALLRWIDYRDPNDDDSHAAGASERRGSGNGHANGASSKKKSHAQGKSHNPRASSQDGLIGVSYESSKAGDAPDGAPPRRKNTGTPEPQQERAPNASYTISAPRDAQLISDASSWTNKMGIAATGPSLEEKKQRKRSFFGFGPRMQPTSNQEAPIVGNSGSPEGNQYNGPVRQVFGAPLADAVRFNSPTDVSVPLPAVVYRCIQYLDARNAINEEGIFRLSGSNVVIKQLRERFNTEGDVNLLTDETYYDIHAVASLLKLYLRELPTTILTRDLHVQFLQVTEMSGLKEKTTALAELVQHLPQANGILLHYLIAFLIKIINNADFNKMTVRNVGIVFSPTLNIPAPVFALLLQNYEAIFNIRAEEYELPSPMTESEPQARRPSLPGPAGSPHRQRLVEQSQQRSTPTPPPALIPGNQSLRATPTPPPVGRQIGYEPQYLAQQQYDPMALQGQAQSAYDRPHYQGSYEQGYGNGSLASNDQAYVNRPNRRESSMFMGNMMLNHQGSKSRLREDGRM